MKDKTDKKIDEALYKLWELRFEEIKSQIDELIKIVGSMKDEEIPFTGTSTVGKVRKVIRER